MRVPESKLVMPIGLVLTCDFCKDFRLTDNPQRLLSLKSSVSLEIFSENPSSSAPRAVLTKESVALDTRPMPTSAFGNLCGGNNLLLLVLKAESDCTLAEAAVLST